MKGKRIILGLLAGLIIFGAVGFGINYFKGSTVADDDITSIVELTDRDGTLTALQIKSLNSGACIKYNDEIYQLARVGENKIYAYTDAGNALNRKFISVNETEATFKQWIETDENYVNKALLDSYLKEYVKNKDLNNTLSDYTTDSALRDALADYIKNNDLSDTLKDYATDSDMNAALSAALADYMRSSEIQSLITTSLASYVKNSDGKGLVNMYYLYNSLTFKTNTLYAVQGFDNTQNLADFTIVGGGKDGKTGRFALVFVGGKINESLIVYQTGSVLISDLAGTSGGSTGIKPASNGYLRVFEIGGKVF